jgi:hypothetical protein
MTFSLTALCRTIKCDIADHNRLPFMANSVMVCVTVLIVLIFVNLMLNIVLSFVPAVIMLSGIR